LKNGLPSHPRRISLFRIGMVCLVLFFAAADAGAAPTLVQTNRGTANAASITVSFASPPTAGNLLIAMAGNQTCRLVTMPAGWLNAIQAPCFAPGHIIIYKVAAAAEPSAVTITYDGATRAGLQIYEYSGIPGAVVRESALNTGTDSSLESASVTTTTNDELVIAGFAISANTSFSSWSNAFTERNDFASTLTYGGADRVAPTPGIYSTTATAGSAGAWTGQIARFSSNSYSISGNVYEDVNYGGGAGRDRASSSGVVRSGARVELYNNSGNFVDNTTTDGSGNYSFTGLTAASYTVRVVSASVTSSRTGYVAGLRPVMTFRTNASSGTAVAVTDYVGGHDPATQDVANAAAGWILNAATGVFSGSGSGKAHAFAPVTVSGANVTGVDFGWNFDTIVNTNETGQGSLRMFIINANTLGGDASLNQSGLVANKENAVFMISNGTDAPGLRAANNYFSGGVATISPASALPTISTPMVLNAQKQPGWTLAPIVELNGTNASTASGLKVTGGGSTVRGFVVNNFQNWYGIELTGSGGNVVAGNYLNLNAAGTAAAPIQMFGGVGTENSPNNTIGGTAPADRNVVGGVTMQTGIYINGAASAGNVILGNYIGLNAAGTAAIPSSVGVTVGGPNNTIGGTAVGAGNVISGNIMYGVYVIADGNTVQGNRIGLAASGAAVIENQYGVMIWGGRNNTIGGTAAGAGNAISGNRFQGVIVEGATATGNAILGNAMYGNGTLGIDLGNNGVTANDGAKPAGQPNLYMDFPVFTSASLSGTTLTVSGYVGSAPNQATFANARVEVFKSDNDGSGYGEGRSYLGFLTADGSGNFSGSLTVGGLAGGDRITGTATDGSNNTSEFGANVTVTSGGTCSSASE